ncbi:MAG: serine/threonine-protein kinase [Sandaracinaceae bacterium]
MASPVPAITVTADPHASEEVRFLMQQRLALLGLVTLCLSGVYLGVAVSAELVLDGLDALIGHLRTPNRLLNLIGAAVSLGVWLVARRGTLSPRQLLLLDGTGTFAAIVPYTLMATLGQIGMAGVFLTTLTLMLVLQTRALMVPSDARRTLGIGVVGGGLAVGLGTYVYATEPGQRGDQDLVHIVLNLALWCVIVIAVSTVASWILFGLRTQITEARRLGQYILGEKLGAGGMGVVYRATHAMLRRPTALKLLEPSRAGEAAVARFEREVQLTASLQHPNTVKIFDYGRTPDGVFYYVMEYLDGGDLEAVVAVGGPLPASRVVHLLSQVAAGLAEAHEIGLIHRDIKPENILVAASAPVADLAKVVDFGLVRELGPDPADPAITRTDTVMGTPLYMAPECVTDPQGVDSRADLYSLGAVGYFLLTGTPVFEGATVVEVCSHHLHTAPEPPSARLGAPVPEMLEEVILRCLAKERDARPKDAAELGALLEACGEEVGRWTREDARVWWAEHRDALKARVRGERNVSGTAATIAVDLAGRGAS